MFCPLCRKYEFPSVETALYELVNVTVRKFSCPICLDYISGIDKFTIHLCAHVLQTEQQITRLNNSSDNLNNELKNICISAPTVVSSNESHVLTHSLPLNFNKNNAFLSTTIDTVSMPLEERAQNEYDAIENLDNASSYSVICSDKHNLDLLQIASNNNNDLSCNCTICNLKFENESLLSMHNKLMHHVSLYSLPVSKFPCSICNKSFKIKASLVIHQTLRHGINQKEQTDVITNMARSEQNGNKQHTCYVCNKTFQKDHHLSQHLKTHDSKNWNCEICNKHYTTKYFLRKHKLLHTGETPYMCTICDKKFTFQQSYHKHLLYHNNDKPYTCTDCGRSFKELSTLHNHQRIHTGEKPFQCTSCGKKFRQRVSYLVHSRIHTGIKPYECTACHKHFRYKVSERSHKCKASPPGQIVYIRSNFMQNLTRINNSMNSDKCMQNITENVINHTDNTKYKTNGSATIIQEINHSDSLLNDTICQYDAKNKCNNTVIIDRVDQFTGAHTNKSSTQFYLPADMSDLMTFSVL